MTDERDEILAAEYVLGLAAAPDERAAPGRIDGDEGFRRRVAEWEARLAPLAGAQAVAPPAGLWERIEARLEGAEAAPGTRTIAPEDGVWEPLAPGVERKVVHVDRAAGRQSFYLRMAEGAVLPAHRHGPAEHCVVLEGELGIGDAVFGAGAFHFAAAGTPHPPITARAPALLFIHGGL